MDSRGLAAVTGALLTEGSLHRDADAFHASLDALGAELAVHVDHDFAEIDLVLLSETLAEGLDLLADAVLFPAFPADQTERVRAETLDGIAARLDEPANVADDRLALELFGDGHPYGIPAFGSPEAVTRLAPTDLQRFWLEHYRPSGSFLVACGDFDSVELRVAIERALGAWSGAAPQLDVAPPRNLPPQGGKVVRVPWADAFQAEIRVGSIGMSRRSPDWMPAAVANYILGGSTITGRLGANLREDKGWTYGVRCGFSEGMQPAGWGVDTAVDAEVEPEAIREIHHEIQRLREEPVGEAELEQARDALILSLPRAFETPGRIVSRLAVLEAHGFDASYWDELPARIRAVTAEEVQRIAQNYFGPERLVTVVVGAIGNV